jgi:L-ribulose-5-phosphate 4-epimerase
MMIEHLVITDLEGKRVEGEFRPSSDLPTHLVLYRTFPEIGSVAHTHSEYATAWAQARKPIPCFGTTHADCFHGTIPVTDVLDGEEIESEYETNTGHAIVRVFKNLDYAAVPAVLVANHGPFTWGRDARTSAHNAVILEAVARTAYFTRQINPDSDCARQVLQDKHYNRKHGRDASYGQKKGTK